MTYDCWHEWCCWEDMDIDRQIDGYLVLFGEEREKVDNHVAYMWWCGIPSDYGEEIESDEHIFEYCSYHTNYLIWHSAWDTLQGVS